jgi:hypothetical protein
MNNIHLIATEQSHLFYHNCTKKFSYKIDKYNECKKSKCRHPQDIYITNDEEIKEGDYFWKPDCNMIFKAEYTPHKGCQKIILTTDQELIKDCVQAIDDELLEWFVKNPSCESVDVQKWASLAECGYSYQIIIPKENPKQRAKNYMSLKGALEPNQIKCYCGHTSYCDCSPLDESKKTSVNWLIETLESDIKVDESNMVTIKIHEHDYIKSKQVALEMEKKQIIEAYDQGDIQLVNAEHYFDKTYG